MRNEKKNVTHERVGDHLLWTLKVSYQAFIPLFVEEKNNAIILLSDMYTFFPVISISIRPQRELLHSGPESMRWDIIYWKWAQGMITRERRDWKKKLWKKMSTKSEMSTCATIIIRETSPGTHMQCTWKKMP